MKPLNEYPTPETDGVVTRSLEENGGLYMTEVLLFNSRSLEQRLALARDALSAAMNEYDRGGKCWHSNEVAGQMRAALAATAPKP